MLVYTEEDRLNDQHCQYKLYYQQKHPHKTSYSINSTLPLFKEQD